jgi:hypothetical protein
MMIARGESQAGREVTGIRGEKDGVGKGGDGAGTQLGVNKDATQEVRAIRSGVRTEGVDIGEGRRGLGKGPMKKGIGVVVHGVGIAGGLGGADEDPRAPVMVRGGSQPVGPDAVVVP